MTSPARAERSDDLIRAASQSRRGDTEGERLREYSHASADLPAIENRKSKIENPLRSFDFAVVGAGPAGSVAALMLARRGHRVVLIDKATFPRQKVCGCCLNPRVVHALRALGLEEPVRALAPRALHELCLGAGGRSVRVEISGGLVLSRAALDQALLNSAQAAGADVRTGVTVAIAATLPGFNGSRCLLVGNTGEEINANVIIAATGLGSRFARAEQAADEVAPRSRFGVGAILPDAPAAYAVGTVYMACGRGGYVGLVRLEDQQLDIAAALDPPFVRACGGVGAATARLIAAAGFTALPQLADVEWRGTPALTRSASRLAAERVFRIGDAAGYVEPFTGEGIAWAMETALAVVPYAESALERWDDALAFAWQRRHAQIVRRRQHVIRFLAWLLRSPGRMSVALALLTRFPGIAKSFTARIQAAAPAALYHPA